ncbi:unnamed protein product [Fraxinus pennsylvanica]|uniref:Uncharacterized protein n=1 Tax=Fraxinus pennsylvanica TaxID=56036 RepID=A0AAD1ZLG4_9LAMI|nr:unnamed protein product [Fraxinus pennsylvanica]
MMCWVPFLAHRSGIKAIFYVPVSSASVGFLLSETASIESHTNGPPGFPPSIRLYKHVIRRLEVFDSEKEVGSGLTIKQRLRTSICESDAIGFKTCRETEGPYIEYIENNFKKPVLLAGPVVPKPPSSFLEENEAILQKDQFQELVLGFEHSGHPFFAALKPPFGSEIVEEALPEGFKARTQEKGVVYGGWVQQQLILSHPSVGCFVTHGGYASLWEGLVSECQLVVLPHRGEHYIQAKVLSAHLKVGVEVEKGDKDGLFTKEGVNEAIMAVMKVDSETGNEVKRNHDKLRDFLLSKGLEDSYMDGFVQKMIFLLE